MGFNTDETLKWNSEWQDMPEFNQEDELGFRNIIIHFKDQESVDNFAKLLNQTITSKTKYLWYPKAEIDFHSNLRWKSES